MSLIEVDVPRHIVEAIRALGGGYPAAFEAWFEAIRRTARLNELSLPGDEAAAMFWVDPPDLEWLDGTRCLLVDESDEAPMDAPVAWEHRSEVEVGAILARAPGAWRPSPRAWRVIAVGPLRAEAWEVSLFGTAVEMLRRSPGAT
jgi:hypothetical protein